MAHVFKSHIVNSEDYPMPTPAAGHLAHGQHAAPAGDPGATAEQLRPQVSELERLHQQLGQVRAEVEQLAGAARAKAVEEGYQEGFSRAQNEVNHHVMEAVATLTGAQRERQEVARQHQGALASLALKIAQRVVGEHIELDPSIVARIVESTIRELEPSSSLTVRANPLDLPALEAQRAQLDRLLAGGEGQVELVGDETVDRGGCVLVTPVGEVDARLHTKLAVLETAFAAQRRQPGAGA